MSVRSLLKAIARLERAPDEARDDAPLVIFDSTARPLALAPFTAVVWDPCARN